MKLNATRYYTVLFGALIFLQLYLPSFRTNIFLQMTVLLLILFLEKRTVSENFLQSVKPLAFLFLICFIGWSIHSYKLFNVIKDIFHFLKPILGLSLGYFMFRRIDDFRFFVQTIVVLGFLSALTHFFILIFLSGSSSLEEIREFAKDNFLELFSLLFLAYYKKFTNGELFDDRRKYYLFVIVILLSCVLYFSRTMIVGGALLLLTIYGYSRITPFTIKILGASALVVVMLYAYLYSVKIERDGPGIENFLYKVKIAPEELFQTRIDRENHAQLWDHWRGYEVKRAMELMYENPESFIFGNGHGSLVNLRFFAPLTGEPKGMKFISELHNGYIYIFYKTGIIGMFFYLSLLFFLYRKLYETPNFTRVFMAGIALFFLFTTLTITGMYNPKDVVIFILGALLYFEGSTKALMQQQEPQP